MTPQKKKASINAKKATSLLKKIQEMIESDTYCVDIMQQNLAVIGLLKSMNQQLLEGHLNSCFIKSLSAKNKKTQEQAIQELLQIAKLSNK
jgi:DNA-binding FrmR family transcriptional regulator